MSGGDNDGWGRQVWTGQSGRASEELPFEFRSDDQKQLVMRGSEGKAFQGEEVVGAKA